MFIQQYITIFFYIIYKVRFSYNRKFGVGIFDVVDAIIVCSNCTTTVQYNDFFTTDILTCILYN